VWRERYRQAKGRRRQAKGAVFWSAAPPNDPKLPPMRLTQAQKMCTFMQRNVHNVIAQNSTAIYCFIFLSRYQDDIENAHIWRRFCI
jgi:hypothetical protein